jgi:DNA-directed RNA polymerase II subunit RPB1
MFREGLLMQDIHFALDSFYGNSINCMFSDDNHDELVFRIRLHTADDPSKFVPSDDMITDLKALEQNVLENIVVRGIKGIQNAQMDLVPTQRYNPRASVFTNSKEWVISTLGTNLATVLGFPGVDSVRTVSNDVHEIYNVLGIEAARACIVNEINECLADVAVNYRHIALLADVMTYKGTLLSIDRHGINRSDIGPLAKCSFEETSDMLIKAGMFAEYDPVNGVSANIMLGQVPPCGTGDTVVVIDEEKLRALNPQTIKQQAVSWADMADEDADNGDVCTMEGLDFDFKLDGM